MRPGERYRFGDFELDLARECLVRRGAEIPLAPQPFALLRLLVERNDELVSRDEAARHLWGDRQVETEQGLNYCVRQIRRALDDSADQPLYVQTVPRRGYRFLAPVTAVASPEPELISQFAVRGIAAATIAAIVIGTWWIWTAPAAVAQIVVQPAQVTGLPTGDFVADALLERLRADLRQIPGVRLVDEPSADPAAHQFAVHTRVSDHPRGVQIELELTHGSQGEPVWSANGTAAAADLGPLDQDLRHDLVANLRRLLDGTAMDGEQTIERSRSLPDEHDH